MATATRPGELSPRRQETRNRLIDAGITIIAEHGIGGCTVEQICDEAGYTRGAFYSNFESKDELCAAILHDRRDAVIAATRTTADAMPATFTSSSDAADAAVDRYLALQRVDARWPVVSAELRLHALRSQEFRPTYLAWHEEIREQVVQIFALALEQRGLHLPVPVPQAIDLMEGVSEVASFSAKLRGMPADTETAANLKAMLAALLGVAG